MFRREMKARAAECRLLAVDATSERRDKLLALADEYDGILASLQMLTKSDFSPGEVRTDRHVDTPAKPNG